LRVLRRDLFVLAFVLNACGATSPAPEEPAPVASQCPSIVAEGPYTRAIDGASRACASDSDCVTVRLDCSNLRCSAVGQAFAETYSAPIDCAGYAGAVGNYDCMPRFGSERPVCLDGCCVSERVQGRATADEACRAIVGIYAPGGCTVFGPTFSVDQCLEDVAGIQSAADATGLRRLQVGLDCARLAESCAQLDLCVAQFRGSDATHD
jgi:hypothetical protein